MCRSEVRLPARGSGYTTSAHRAIRGVGAEVDDDWQRAFVSVAHEEDEARDGRRRETIRNISLRIAAETNTLHVLLKSARGIDPATRNRARRATHDLQQIAKELDSDG